MHRTSTRLISRAILAAALAAAGAAPFAVQAAPDHHTRAEAECRNCGTVVSNHTYKREPQSASGVGGVGGAVVGGLLATRSAVAAAARSPRLRARWAVPMPATASSAT